jgi:hypothetical protein
MTDALVPTVLLALVVLGYRPWRRGGADAARRRLAVAPPSRREEAKVPPGEAERRPAA